MENWKPIPEFSRYDISDMGNVRNRRTGRILKTSRNQSGVVFVGMMKDGERKQHSRVVSHLVAQNFLPPPPTDFFDSVINLNGMRADNRMENLAWRPLWFMVRYQHQFESRLHKQIDRPIMDRKSGEQWINSWECAKANGLLETDVVLAIMNHTYTWPTYQMFEVLEV